jgi:hypothetical protein
VKSIPLAPKLRGRHCHGCLSCRRRYTDGCSEPLRNGHCRDCSGAHTPRASWDRTNDPQPCCFRSNRSASTTDRQNLRLGGPETDTWWICVTCWRQHPVRPVEDL